jgi:hypothetical protein
MEQKHLRYVHVLLFRCKQCSEPLTIPVKSTVATLEEIDAENFDLECKCGWSQKLFGLEATRHWSVRWGGPQDTEQLRSPHRGENDASQEA